MARHVRFRCRRVSVGRDRSGPFNRSIQTGTEVGPGLAAAATEQAVQCKLLRAARSQAICAKRTVDRVHGAGTRNAVHRLKRYAHGEIDRRFREAQVNPSEGTARQLIPAEIPSGQGRAETSARGRSPISKNRVLIEDLYGPRRTDRKQKRGGTVNYIDFTSVGQRHLESVSGGHNIFKWHTDSQVRNAVAVKIASSESRSEPGIRFVHARVEVSTYPELL